MSQKNIKDNTPTGKIKTKVVTDARRKAREEQDKNRRINSLKRRCAHRGISEEDTNKYVEKLVEQLNTPKKYAIHVLFDVGQKDKTSLAKLAKEAILNNKIQYKILTDSWSLIEGDEKVLAKLREILPMMAKIYPYAMKPEAILPQVEKKKEKKPSNNKVPGCNKLPAGSGKSKAKANLEEFIKKRKTENIARKAALKASHKACKTVDQGASKKRSKAVKMAPEAIKEAA